MGGDLQLLEMDGSAADEGTLGDRITRMVWLVVLRVRVSEHNLNVQRELFRIEAVQTWCTKHAVGHRTSTPAHPQGSRIVE